MERRFAILIGINDYSDKELDFCVKDVHDIKTKIQECCEFNSNDIRVITSTKSSHISNINELFTKALSSIEQDFNKTQDSIFFFFSGHGSQNSDGSVLKFHTEEIQLQNIINSIEEQLNPKHEFYVIDACYSGEKFKGVIGDEVENVITTNKFSLKSESFNILTASRFDQPATEKRKFQNGTLTHYFLKCIETESNYNQFGFLSPDSISNYVQINVSLEKEFDQIPYSLNKNSGTFPFAFKKLGQFGEINERDSSTIETTISEAPTVHFNYRLTEAFPGVRNIMWFEDKVALEGLIRFFEKPVIYDKAMGYGVTGDPIWWFRGSSALPIRRFEKMSNDKVLLNSWELKIGKIAIFNGSSYWNNIIYVETKPDEPTTCYKKDEEETIQYAKEKGYASDYFGFCNGKVITPEQAQDGGGIIEDKFYKFENAEVRQRFITPFNFILVAKFSPANTREGNMLGRAFMNNILWGNNTFEEFVEEYDKFPRHISD